MYLAQRHPRSSNTASLSSKKNEPGEEDKFPFLKPVCSIEEDKAADVYAYAIILWELLERKIPWQGLSNEEIEFQVRAGQRPSLSVVQPPKKNENTDAIIEVNEDSGHARQSTKRTTASSIITSFKRFAYHRKEPQDEFDGKAFTTSALCEVMEACWQAEPHERPQFSSVKSTLHERFTEFHNRVSTSRV